jgi:hypothetical protein
MIHQWGKSPEDARILDDAKRNMAFFSLLFKPRFFASWLLYVLRKGVNVSAGQRQHFQVYSLRISL